MTISSTSRKTALFTGNGVLTSYPFTFKVQDSDDISVLRVQGDVEAEVSPSVYTVVLNVNQNTNPGGTVEFDTAPTSVQDFVITTGAGSTQELDLQNQGVFNPVVVTEQLDKLTILVQQLEERLSRALLMPITSPGVTTVPGPETRAGNALGFDASGDITVLGLTDLDVAAVNAEWLRILQSADPLSTIDRYKLPGYSDTQALQAWVASGHRYVKLTRDVTVTAQIAIPEKCILDLGGYTLTKGFNGNMLTMGDRSTIMPGYIDGNGTNFTGNILTISGGVGVGHQILFGVHMVTSEGYNVEFVGDGSGAVFAWIGGSFNRMDSTLDAIKQPDNDSASTGLRKYIGLTGSGSAFLDVAGGRATYISACDGLSITLRDASAYLILDRSRIAQFIDRRAVTGATQANPCVVTSANHGLENGNTVTFYGVGGMTQLNGNTYTVANKTADTFELSATNSTAYGAYTSGGTLKNRSTHMIRGTDHYLQNLLGTSLGGAAHITLAKDAARNALEVHTGYTLVDSSAVTTNRVLYWPDKVQHRTTGPYELIDHTADGVDLWGINIAGNSRFRLGTQITTGHVLFTALNGVDLRLGVGAADDLQISSTRILATVPLCLTDGIAAPAATVGEAKLFVDAADGDLKIIFGDGTVKTITVDT